MTRKRAIAGLVGPAVLLPILAFLHNNRSWQTTSRADFEQRLESARVASRDWALGRDYPLPEVLKARFYEFGNGILLHMLVEAAEMAGENDLKPLVRAYVKADPGGNGWGRLADPSVRFEMPKLEELARLEEYQRWFLHALGGDQFPFSPDEQARLLLKDAYRRGRLTHQVIALYLYGRYYPHGPAADEARALMPRLAERIAQEAALDFRVTDLYLQRIVCLLLAGRADLVKPRWIERVLAAQQEDGGWKYRWFGWDSRIFRFSLRPQRTHAHATAQGLWLVSLLKYKHPEWIARHYR